MGKVLRLLFAIQFVAILAYTGYTISLDGWNLIPIFLEQLTEMRWPGQFNFDFMNYLILSALWVAWRHKFSVQGIVFGLMASVLGILFLSAYLFVVSGNSDGEMKQILLGERMGD